MYKLRLRSQSEEIDFISDYFSLEDGGLMISTPEQREVWGSDSVFVNGSQLILSSFGNREATIKMSVYGETRDIVLFNVARIERIIEQAKRRSREEKGERVELLYAWESTVSDTYLEVVSGRLEWPENVMSVEQVHQHAKGYYGIEGFTITLVLTPFAYPLSPVYETPAFVNISNSLDTGTQVTIHNCNDVTHDNWFEIAADEIVGAYPAPILMQLTGDSGESEKISKVYIGVRKDNTGFKSVFEDAEATYRIGGVGTIADADFSSGGTYSSLVYTQTDPGSHPPIQEAILITWHMSDAQMDATQGPFRIFGRVKHSTYWDSNSNYCLRVSYNGTTLYQTEWRTPLNSTTTLFDFGTVFLPPWMGGLEDLAGLDISIVARRKTYGTTTINLDYLTLLPQDGGYRVLQFRGGGLGQAEDLIDDGWSKSVYHVNLSGKKSGIPFAMLPPILLEPNKTHRFYFLLEGTAGSTEITRKIVASIGVVPTYMVLS